MFLRSFFSFWLATILIALISMGMVAMTHPRSRIQSLALPLPELRACVAESLQAPSAGKSTQLAAQCRVVSILDESKTERLASRASADVRSLAARVSPSVPLNLRPVPHGVMVAFDAPINNTHLVAVAILPVEDDGPPPFLWWQFVVATVVSAITCLVLTRHFVGPIRKLQLSTESFGRGNLESQPDALLLKRKDELGDLSKTIAQMSARISGLLSAQRNFFIQVAHELGSPLTRLNVALALTRRKINPELAPELDRLQKESSELNAMVQQLLSLARLESGLEGEGQEAFALRELIEEVCFDNQLIANETGKQLRLLSAPRVLMWGYRELLKRALDNVLRNAIRFTPEGSCVEVEVLGNPDADLILIQVRDGGMGVQDDKLAAIFEPFVRGSSDRSGAGLGLAIAKRAILANRGTIKARNLKECGLMIEISLPCAPRNDMVPAHASGADDDLSGQA